MLRIVAGQLGVPMNDIAEDAVRQELILLGAGLEQQLSEVVAALRAYRPDRDVQPLIEAYVAGEANEDPMQARQIPESAVPTEMYRPVSETPPELRSALAAFEG